MENGKSNEQSSTSKMDYSNDITNENHDRFVDATIDVVNATNLKSSMEIRGFQGIRIDGISLLGRVKPRSYAFLCTQNSIKEKSWKKYLIQFGKRLPNDFLVRYQSEHSKDGTLRLGFHDPSIKLNYISVAVNVRILAVSYIYLWLMYIGNVRKCPNEI